MSGAIWVKDRRRLCPCDIGAGNGVIGRSRSVHSGGSEIASRGKAGSYPVSARRFVAGFWVASMVISGALGALIYGFDGGVALIWGAAALFVPVGVLLAPTATKGTVAPSGDGAVRSAALLPPEPDWILDRDPDPSSADGDDPAPPPSRPDSGHVQPRAADDGAQSQARDRDAPSEARRPWVAGVAVAGAAVWLLSRMRGSSRR